MNKYSENQVIKIAKRYNNSKRKYLLVDPFQAKHIPVSPCAALDLMNALGKTVQEKYPEAFLVIGFAETATAISSAVAENFKDCFYIQTTRENICGKRRCALAALAYKRYTIIGRYVRKTIKTAVGGPGEAAGEMGANRYDCF